MSDNQRSTEEIAEDLSYECVASLRSQIKAIIKAALDLERQRVEEVEAYFKNFHKNICSRFGYGHDEDYWQHDQASLIEFISTKLSEANKKVEELEATGYICGALEGIGDKSLPGVFQGGCGQNVNIADAYRCSDCTASFHKDCIRFHFEKEDKTHLFGLQSKITSLEGLVVEKDKALKYYENTCECQEGGICDCLQARQALSLTPTDIQSQLEEANKRIKELKQK